MNRVQTLALVAIALSLMMIVAQNWISVLVPVARAAGPAVVCETWTANWPIGRAGDKVAEEHRVEMEERLARIITPDHPRIVYSHSLPIRDGMTGNTNGENGVICAAL